MKPCDGLPMSGSGASNTSAGVAASTPLAVSGYDVVRVLVAGLLLTAAALKGYALATEPTAETGLLTSRWFLIGVVEFELFFGLWLLGGFYPQQTRKMAVVVFSAFAVTALYKGIGGKEPCGCFGSVQLSPWVSLVIDLAVVAALSSWRPSERVRSAVIGSLRMRAKCVGLLFATCAIPAAVAMGTYTATFISTDGVVVGQGQTVLLRPEEWIGQRLPIIAHIDIADELEEGRWLLVLYHHACPKCRAALPEYEELARRLQWDAANDQKLALVELPPYGEPEFFDAPAAHGRISDSWTCGPGLWTCHASCD